MADGNGIVDTLRAGLTASTLRSRALANNLANLNTPGYRRETVDFEARLAEALKSGSPVDLAKLTPQVVRPMNTPVAANGNDVSMEMEVGEMISSGGRYKTYMRVLTKVYRQMELAMNTD